MYNKKWINVINNLIMNEEHFNKKLFELEQQSFQPFASWQLGDCYFCYRFLKCKQIKTLKLKDKRVQTVCFKCKLMYVVRTMLLLKQT